jgi:RNA-binding protein
MSKLSLSNAQVKYLRGLAHGIRPVVMVGNKGLTDTLVQELETAIDFHELVKVKLATDDRDARVTLATELATRSKAEIVQRVGKVVCLFRRNRDKPRIALPD